MLDKIIVELDRVLNTLLQDPHSIRPHPDTGMTGDKLTQLEVSHSLGLMRVNHCGEVCAQALYQGQELTARDTSMQAAFRHAAFEETEHLAWTKARIHELGGRTSILNPIFYMGSLALGIIAGMIGDKWSLGFLEETERQVEAHLKEHQELLPAADAKSRAILHQMQLDEAKHAAMAHSAGAELLPGTVKASMHILSLVMKKTTYYI